MDRQDFEDKLIDYLYDEMEPAERGAFQSQLHSDPTLQADTQSYQRIARLYRSNLPLVEAPPALSRKILAKVKRPKRVRWTFLEFGAFWRPVLTGVFAIALTLGLVYQYKQWRDRPMEIAKNTPIPGYLATIGTKPETNQGGDLSLEDLSATVAQPLPVPVWRTSPSLGNGLISLASYGNSNSIYDPAPSADIYRLEQQAQFSVAQFLHQEALRMHALGDHRGAAETIANLIKKYPNYPRIFEALALRIGCLFQIGQVDKANQELAWLRQNSPELAQLVEQRWRQR